MVVSADQEHSMLHRKPRILVVGSFVMDVIATTEQGSAILEVAMMTGWNGSPSTSLLWLYTMAAVR